MTAAERSSPSSPGSLPADIRSRPDVDDIGPHLAGAAALLCRQRDVIDAAYEHDPYSATVRFVLSVRSGISEIVAVDQAFAALQWAATR